MTCPRCQHANRAGAKFCEECATPLTRTCAQCGSEVSPTVKFCPECAHPVSGAAVGQPRVATPESYTPKHLAEKILTSKAALEGERKHVTVLFADLKGSMELLADRDPEEGRKILDPVLERMMEAVHRYEGTVNQVMGDGIMALFGAPLAHEDHGVRACLAALRMRETIRAYSEEVRRKLGVPVAIRVGLNSGEVVVRTIGSDLRMDYSAVGQATHLAARMEQAALPDTILATADTVRLAEGYVQVKPLGPITVKGLSEPVDAYEVMGAGVVRTRLQATAARGLTRFVGRDGELEHLRRMLDAAAAGCGQVTAIVGEPGVGKSRLVHELTHSHRAHGWLVVETAAASYGKSTAYLPIIDLLKAYFEIGARDDARKIREKLTGKILALDPTLKPTLTALLALLDVPVEDPDWQALDPPQRRRDTLDAVTRLFLRESQVQPLLLVVDDLHWIDSETQAILDALVESLPAARLLLIVNYRPEYQHAWGTKTYYTALRVGPLPAASADSLLKELVGDTGSLAPLGQLLFERTGGNPFFLEESVRMLIETKTLIGTRGAYRLARPLDGLQVPATVHSVLAARIDRLSPEEKSLLQVAAVIGEVVPLGLLLAVAEMPAELLHRALAHVEAGEFVYEASLFPDLEYAFKHGLTYQVAYGSLLLDQRRALHARTAAAIAALWPDRLNEHLERLAYHTVRAEEWDAALGHLRQAGAKALSRSANREAAIHFEQALAALSHLPESGETSEQAIDLRFELRQALQPLGEHKRVLDYLREAEVVASRCDDQRRLGWVSVYLTQYRAWNGDLDRAADTGDRALAIGSALEDFGLQIVANFFLAQASFTFGDFRRAREHCRSNTAVLTGDLVRERFGLAGLPAVLSFAYLARCAAELGEFVEGTGYATEAMRIAENVGQPYSLIVACTETARVGIVKGDVDSATPFAERAFALCETANLPFLFPHAAAALGSTYIRRGRIAEALSLLERAATQTAAPRAWIFIRETPLGEAYLIAGQVEEAHTVALRALAIAREFRIPGQEAWVLRLLGDIASRRAPPEADDARACYVDALAIADRLGMRPLAAHCHLGLGELYRRTGKRQEAQAHLTTATTMYREMDMRFWLEQAEAELRA